MKNLLSIQIVNNNVIQLTIDDEHNLKFIDEQNLEAACDILKSLENVIDTDVDFNGLNFKVLLDDNENSRIAYCISEDDNMFKFEYKIVVDSENNIVE